MSLRPHPQLGELLTECVLLAPASGEWSSGPRLINRFDYDGDYGTVLNRFLVESVIGHPLTVNGTGGQTRAFIHIQNSVQCIRLAVESPPAMLGLGQLARVPSGERPQQTRRVPSFRY